MKYKFSDDWKTRGLCWQKEDPLWFPEQGEGTGVSKISEICFKCPVQKECLEYSLGDLSESYIEWPEYGVWGGYSSSSRRAIRRLIKYYPIEWWVEERRSKARIKKALKSVFSPSSKTTIELENEGEIVGEYSYKCLSCSLKYRRNEKPYPTGGPASRHRAVINTPLCMWAQECRRMYRHDKYSEQREQTEQRREQERINKLEKLQGLMEVEGYKCNPCKNRYPEIDEVKATGGPFYAHRRRKETPCEWSIQSRLLYKSNWERSKTAQGRESLG